MKFLNGSSESSENTKVSTKKIQFNLALAQFMFKIRPELGSAYGDLIKCCIDAENSRGFNNNIAKKLDKALKNMDETLRPFRKILQAYKRKQGKTPHQN